MDVIAVKDWGAISTGHIRGVERAVRSGWPAHIESEPRVRGREAVQRVAAFNNLPSPDKGFHRCGNPPTPSSCGLPRSKILTWKIVKRLRKTYWFRKNKASDSQTHFPSPTLPPPVTPQPGRGSRVNSNRAALPVTSGSSKNIQARRPIAYHLPPAGVVP